MNFDSIEGLTADEINELFNNISEGEMVSTHFVCACKATLGEKGTHLEKFPNFDGWCHMFVDTTLIYSEAACREKCFQSFGDYTVAHKFTRDENSNCYGWYDYTFATRHLDGRYISWGCLHFGSTCSYWYWNGSGTGRTTNYTSACLTGTEWMNATFGRCYQLKQR